MTRMAQSATAGPVTWDAFVALDEDDRRELIDGHLLEVDVPTEAHEYIVGMLCFWLVAWAREHGGRVLPSGYKIRVSERRGVRPDVQFYRGGRPANPPQGLELGAPDLVVEVVSPSSKRYDHITKLNWYRDIGAPEYWIVDPETRSVQRLVLDGPSYRVDQALSGGTFEPGSFAGLAIDLDELFTLPE